MTFAEKIRTINVGRPSRRTSKRTTSDFDGGKATVTEHWNDRVDVNIQVETVRAKASDVKGKP